MRVVGGLYRGRILTEFKGNEVRPTSDMARESLFNILQNKIADTVFLDLFCGTGAVGIEALSRGALSVYFNDKSKESVKLTKLNLEKLNAENFKVSNLDAISFIESTRDKFDIIFIDAPYIDPIGLEALKKVHNIMTDKSIVIFENEKPFNSQLDFLEKYDERRYGRAYLTFFKKKL